MYVACLNYELFCLDCGFMKHHLSNVISNMSILESQNPEDQLKSGELVR